MIEGILRFFGTLANPIGFVWLTLLAGTILCLRKKLWRTAVVGGVLVVGISVAGSRVSLNLLGSLEKPYFGTSFDKIPEGDAVMMMGGALEFSLNDPMGFNLNSASDRIVTALELVRRGKGKALVLGGGGDPAPGELNQTEALNRWLADWKISSVPVHLLGVCANTRDEATKVAELARKQGWKKVVVVTSACHMRRTEAVFRTLGIEVVPAPCDFHKLGTPFRGFYSPVPSVGHFSNLDVYLHEKIGWLVYRYRGWISSEAAAAVTK
jgi:uncharacterized SAM-binding protein YcdF (DUF218 family)